MNRVGRFDLPLRLEQLRQVRVTVYRDAVGAHRHDCFQGGGETLHALLGQAVDQVDVDRAEAVAAAGVDHRAGLLDRLDAVHRFLHRRVEVLHAEAGAVEADLAERGDVVGIDEARVEFDRDVAIRRVRETEMAAQGIDDVAQLRR